MDCHVEKARKQESVSWRTRMLFVWAGFFLAHTVSGVSRPNIVFILADDLGWSDIGAYGQDFAETPHLDRLARQGMRFTNAYAPAPICSASRAAILTGRSPARLHFESVSKAPPKKPENIKTPLRQPPHPVNLPLEEISLAEALAPAGYVTGFFGKWHLTQENERYLGHGEKFGPRQQGFRFSSEERGSHPYNYPGGKKSPPPPSIGKAGEFAPDALTDAAIAFLQAQQNERFFLYLSQYFVHEPIHTRCLWLIEKYRAKADRLGRTVSESALQYAAFLETMDHQVGRVLQALDDLKLSETTLVVFMSDNGGHPNYTTRTLRGSKWTLYEGGVREPFLARWPGKIPAGVVSDVPVIGTDLMPTFCAAAGTLVPEGVSLDGISLLPLLTGTGSLSREFLYWHYPYYHPAVDNRPVSSLRQGTEKLLYFYEDERLELYDLAVDPLEKNNLAALRPARVRELKEKLLAQLRSVKARFPVPVFRQPPQR